MNFDYIILFQNACLSLFRVLTGACLALFIGLALATLRSLLPARLQKNKLFNFCLDLYKYPPPIAWIPFAIYFFGIGSKSSIIIVFIAALPSIHTNCYESLINTPGNLVKFCHSLELSKWNLIKHLYFPSILPNLFTGARVGLSYGWMSIIASEMISTDGGLGYNLQLLRINLDFTGMLFNMFIISVIGFLMNDIIARTEKKVIRWKH